MPYAAAHGLELIELQTIRRDGKTLYQLMTTPGSRSIPIPVHMGDTGAPGTRPCTFNFKIRVVGRYVREHGATPETPATVGIGFSLDEIGRVGGRRYDPCQQHDYPLLGLRVRRADCPAIIVDAGLPIPPKSACWFCPLHHEHAWTDMRRERPGLFDQACQLEGELNERRRMLGRDEVYLTRFGRPLADVTMDGTQVLFEGAGECDSGYCFT
jgi:hypothetical protein